MQSLIALYFFILAMIQLGLLAGVSHYYKSENTIKPSQYWLGSLAANISALLVFGVGLLFISNAEKPAINFTVANTFFYIAAIYQWLFCRSLSREIPPRLDFIAKISILVFAIIFEFLRHFGNFEIRTSFMVFLATILFTSQFFELVKIRRGDRSPQLKYLQYATVVEMCFALVRLAILTSTTFTIQRVEQLPQALIFFTIAQLVTNTIAYIAIGSYWAEKVSLANARSSSENEMIKKLLVEREDLISHLSKANKTAMTGALSASIAHELNQPIAAIQLNTQFFQTKLSANEWDLQSLRDIAKSIEHDNARIANIVATLRGIFKEERVSTQLVDLRTIIDGIVPIVLPQARDQGIQLQFDQQSQKRVALNTGEFQQVLLNLINNAIDSLAESSISDKTILIKTKDLDHFVEMTISDNGHGVAAELVPSLFELMKTNKKSGMGLGLWLTKHVVERHQGKITYQTSDWGGAEFVIRIPLELV